MRHQSWFHPRRIDVEPSHAVEPGGVVLIFEPSSRKPDVEVALTAEEAWQLSMDIHAIVNDQLREQFAQQRDG